MPGSGVSQMVAFDVEAALDAENAEAMASIAAESKGLKDAFGELSMLTAAQGAPLQEAALQVESAVATSDEGALLLRAAARVALRCCCAASLRATSPAC